MALCRPSAEDDLLEPSAHHLLDLLEVSPYGVARPFHYCPAHRPGRGPRPHPPQLSPHLHQISCVEYEGPDQRADTGRTWRDVRRLLRELVIAFLGCPRPPVEDHTCRACVALHHPCPRDAMATCPGPPL